MTSFMYIDLCGGLLRADEVPASLSFQANRRNAWTDMLILSSLVNILQVDLLPKQTCCLSFLVEHHGL
jgi:hypothetical protein